ncbi:hypothetical protein NOCARDAX2BIS_210166 [Nocardioides sp. AX2bis]|nr:hypothetical protein NOCARDAX2BIS_210166 [Nocardioides sp. AX2bis]
MARGLRRPARRVGAAVRHRSRALGGPRQAAGRGRQGRGRGRRGHVLLLRRRQHRLGLHAAGVLGRHGEHRRLAGLRRGPPGPAREAHRRGRLTRTQHPRRPVATSVAAGRRRSRTGRPGPGAPVH